jgi:pyridoxamine 5'-phosphate oxidase
MSLATATSDGMPSARFVLLKGVDARGFRFFTNHQSRKGEELLANPRAALAFFWAKLERQVRVEGHVERLSVEESAAYFHSRPKGSQISSSLSPQSRPLPDRESLEQQVEAAFQNFAEGDVPFPADSWGGYVVIPERIEFWQGRKSRLHDRFRYQLEKDQWTVERLAP